MVRGIALLLTFLTGFTGLVYEVTWQKYLATLLGSHSEATAAVLGLFLGGLALGYAIFGRVTRRLVAGAGAAARPARLLVAYGAVEAAIGVYALCFPFLFAFARLVSFRLPLGSGALSFGFDVLLSALLIGPPSVLMGATIPMLTQALARGLTDATRFHALVYGFNTTGAFAGALAAGYWLVPTLGLVGVLQAMAILNLVAGAAFVGLGRRPPGSGLPTAQGESGVTRVEGFALLAGVALLVGFAMMTVQTVLIRMGALAFGASQFTFSMVVAVFVLCIALGSFAVSMAAKIPRWVLAASLWGLFALLYLLYTPLGDATYWAHALRSLFRSVEPGFYAFHFQSFVAVLVVIGPSVILSGATLPLLFHHLRREAGELGDVAGRLYSWNTVGSLLGALLGGYALLFWLDLHAVYRLAVAASAAAAALITFRTLPAARLPASAAPLAVALALVTMLPAWSPMRLAAGLFRTRSATEYSFEGPEFFFGMMRSVLAERGWSVISYEDDPTTSVAVKQMSFDDGEIHRDITTNGKSDGAIPEDYATMALAALLPALLAERVERAFVVGLGTGVTSGELAALDSTREVIVAEISPGVIRAAPFFDFGNLEASQNPKIRIVQADAYRALLRSEGRFDVISSEPSNPWVAGVEMLFSREFLEAARDRLTPGGVYAQWFHVYETNTDTIAMVLRTYAAVFDHVTVWYALGTDLLLMGIQDPEAALDLERLARRVEQPQYSAGLERSGISGLAELLAHELLPLGVVHAARLPGPLHTLLHPRLSDSAARAFFAGGTARLPITAGPEAARIGGRNSLVRRYAAQHGGRLPEAEREAIARETCEHRGRECVALLAEWTHDEASSEARQRVSRLARRNREAKLRLVGRLSGLYGEEPLAVDGRPLAERAGRATQLFADHYHHAAPFSRELLEDLWQRCAADASQRDACLETREQLAETLGGLEIAN